MQRKTILIVGASRGIGAATATAMSKADWRVLKASRSLDNKEDSFTLDVRDPKNVAEVFREIEEKNIHLDALLFCSGVGYFAPIEKLTDTQWADTISTNLTGAFYVLRAAFDSMKNNKGGKLLVLGSIADHLAIPENAAYAASKFALRGLTAVLHEEGRSLGISTTLISLGATYTEIWNGREGFNPDDMLAPEQVAQLILDMAELPQNMSIPNITVTPPKGVL